MFLKIECSTAMLWYLDKICSSISLNLNTHRLCSVDKPDNLEKTPQKLEIFSKYLTKKLTKFEGRRSKVRLLERRCTEC